MAEDRVASAGSLSHDNESDREGCRTKEPPDPQATPRRTSRRNLYMRRRRHRDASRHKLALRTLSSLHHSSEEDSQGVRSIQYLVTFTNYNYFELKCTFLKVNK